MKEKERRKKKKAMQMKNNKNSEKKTKVDLSQQSLVLACWVLPLDMAVMLSKADVSQCQMLSTSSPWKPV